MTRKASNVVEYFAVGNVVAHDGDTLVCDFIATAAQTAHGVGMYIERASIRLARIQAEELGSADPATAATAKRQAAALGKLITSSRDSSGIHRMIRILVRGRGTDKYGRIVAEVWVRDTNASDFMLANGCRKYGGKS